MGNIDVLARDAPNIGYRYWPIIVGKSPYRLSVKPMPILVDNCSADNCSADNQLIQPIILL